MALIVIEDNLCESFAYSGFLWFSVTNAEDLVAC